MSQALLPLYDRDITLVKGKGSTLWTSDDRRFLDFCAGIAVNGLGYGDRAVVKAIRDQAGKLMHISNLYHSEPTSRLAQRLVEMSFPSKVFFSNSGSEAVEAAIKFARRVGNDSGRTELFAFERSFHGRTMGALSLTWTPKYREPFAPLLPDTGFLPWGDLAAVAERVGPKTAAVLIEPVQGEGGLRPASNEFLQGLRKICTERGALLIVDEIQCGFGRTGKMFAYEHAGITPDILTVAKPLGGGLPMGATLLAEAHVAKLHIGDHGSTFGGNPVCAAASNAILDRLTTPGFVESVAKKGEQLRKGLKKLQRKHKNQIVDVRGLGLMQGVEFKGDASAVVKGLKAKGILTIKAGEKVLRLLPPLVIKPAEIREFLTALDAVVGELPASGETTDAKRD
ncbi:MAG: aspartate aminotransferase family protein [Vicinamibacteria bacterium]|nr:aspartate aminotransferase family protein [Vicinamibacteria bacterium]MBP9944851.1 aspartate aminotransferase family protein [Vicinamibacteria bacterium]